jgi:ADP-ribose pyrophosphatase YjhB (NUDIX family)
MHSASPQLDATPRAAVSGAIFRDGEVLLVERAKPPTIGLWSLPGGHIEPGETAAEALLRELAEETGIRARLCGVADVVDVIRRDGEGGSVSFHRVIVVFYGIWLGGEPAAADDVSAVIWRRPSDIAILRTTPGLADVVSRAWTRLSMERAGV